MRNLSRLPPETRAILFMVAAIFCLSSMDAVVKSLSGRYEIFQLVWIRYAGQTLLVSLLVWRQLGGRIRTRSPGIQLLRSTFLFAGTVCFFIGFSNIDLAAATAILMVNPVFVAAGAYFVLGERLGWRRMLGICAGFAGAMIIIRPGTAVFSPYALFPLAAAILYSAYAITTRFLSRSEDITSSFFFTTLFGAVLATIIVPFYWTAPSASDLVPMVALTLLGTAGQYLMIRALFLAEASVVAPFGYVGLIYSAFYGMVYFAEFPDLWTWLGAIVVAASGLYIWYRETSRTG